MLFPYICLLFLTITLSSNFIFKEYSKVSHWLGFLIVSLVLGGRYNVGTDYEAYIDVIENINMRLNIEPGFYATTVLFNFLEITPSYQLGIYYVTTAYLIWLSIARWSSNKAISVSIFFGLGYAFLFTNQIRQGLALAICLYSFRYVVENNIRAFYTCMISALLFHYSAIVFCAAYFIGKLKLSNKCLLYMILISLVAGFLLLNQLVDSLFKVYESYAPDLIVKKYSYYFNNQFGNDLIGQRDYGAGIRFIFLNLVAMLLVFKVNRCDDDSKSVIIVMSIIGVCLTNMFTGIEVLSRLVYFYSIFIILAMPFIVDIFSSAMLQFLLKLLIVIAMFTFTLKALLSNVHTVLPYSTYLL